MMFIRRNQRHRTAMPRQSVGEIPELVLMILEFLDPKEDAKALGSAIRVSKLWFETAGNLLWKKVTSRELSSLLWPKYNEWLREVNERRVFKLRDDFEGWASDLREDDYKVFHKYARFICSLRHDDSDFGHGYEGPRHSRLIQAYLTGRFSPYYTKRTRRFIPTLFPRMTELHWVTDHGRSLTAPRVFLLRDRKQISKAQMLILQWSTFLLALGSLKLEKVHIDWPHHVSIPHPRVRYDIDTNPNPVADVDDIDEDVRSDHHNLAHDEWINVNRMEVHLRYSHPRPHCDVLLDFLAKIPNVRSLTIPLLLNADPVVFLGVVSEMRYLEELSTISNRYKYDPCHHANVAPNFPGSWPRLKSLSLHGELEDVTRILDHPTGPKGLESITVRTTKPIFSKIETFYEVVARNNPGLKRLEIFVGEKYMVISPNEQPTPPNEVVSLSVLQPLLSLRDMEVFQFSCNKRLRLSQDDIEIIAVNWPHIRKLRLESQMLSTLDDEESLPNMDALLTLACHCPELEALSIAMEPRLGPELTTRALPLPKFPKLRRLRFLPGSNPITAPAEVSLTIARMCPPNPEFVLHFPWRYPGFDEYLQQLPAHEQDAWHEHRQNVAFDIMTLMNTHRALQAYQVELEEVESRQARTIQELERRLAAATRDHDHTSSLGWLTQGRLSISSALRAFVSRIHWS
ncbi:hypothetical protein K474DRAFT_127420 [Panus rudis PR-1116 ss-1]|nr:hypothetical protein K474DRAFT_127420 [Panus rudis PR-1116 ss-1]